MKVIALLILQCVFALVCVAGPDPTKPAPSPSPAAGKTTLLYSLDYDSGKDVFYTAGTKTPFSGPVSSLYENGVVESTGTLREGVRSGHWIEYYENGGKTSEGDYEHGAEDGEWKYWFENGHVESFGTYKSGSQIGKWMSFFENGKVDSEGIYVDGTMEGAWKFHDQKSDAIRIIHFDQGRQLDP